MEEDRNVMRQKVIEALSVYLEREDKRQRISLYGNSTKPNVEVSVENFDEISLVYDLGIDSLGVGEFIMDVESVFGININVEDESSLKTLKDVLDVVIKSTAG